MNKDKKHEISVQTAIEMTTRFRASKPSDLPLCETFEMEAIRKLLNTAGCRFIRIYYGKKESGNIHAILVAADQDDMDILPASDPVFVTEEEDADVVIIEDGYRCPTLCPPESPLNS